MAEGSSGHHPGGNRRPHRTGHHQLHNLSFQPMIEESFPLFTADEEVASERELLKSVEDGPYMQEVKYIIIHCSATRENRDFTVEDLLRCHRQRKFRTIGYHFYIRRSGIITQHRKLKEVGAHCRPWNRCSIGICYAITARTTRFIRSGSAAAENSAGAEVFVKAGSTRRSRVGIVCLSWSNRRQTCCISSPSSNKSTMT